MDANVGLGPALDRGLEECSHEIVARMDADDISLPERFERPAAGHRGRRGHRRLGLLEFGHEMDDVVGRRTPPTDPEEIRR